MPSKLSVTECGDELDKSKISFWVGLLQVFYKADIIFIL